MTSDVIIKNLAIPQFENHINVFFGEDRYISSRTPKGRVSEGVHLRCTYEVQKL